MSAAHSARRGRAALVLAAWLVAGAARAQSNAESQVELRVSECTQQFEAEVRRLVRLELGDLLHEGPAGAPGENQQLEVRCEAELASVTARSARGDQHADSAVRFDSLPGDAAPRAVALAAVEGLRAVDPTLAARIEARRASPATQPDAPPAQPTASEKPAPAQPEKPNEARPARGFTRLTLGALVRSFVADPLTTVWGARAEVSRRTSIPVDFGLDLEAALATRSVELGAIDVRLLSSGAWLGWRAGRADWTATFGAGWRVGLAELEGSSTDPDVQAHQTSRIWTGPLVLARTDAAFGAFTLALTLEGGVAVLGAEGLAEDAIVVAVGGPWVALALNPGIRF